MNNGMITFEDLLRQAQANAGEDALKAAKDLEAYRQNMEKTQKEIERLQQRLNEYRTKIRELEGKVNEAVAKAITAAKALNIEIPEQYLKMKKTGNGNGNGKSGKYWFEFEGRKAFRGSLTDGLWRLTKGCGTAGRNGEKVMTAEEFWTFFKSQTGEDKMELSKKYYLEFANGEKGYIQLLEE